MPTAARPGSKHHLLADRYGTPLALALTDGDRPDVTRLLPLLDEAPIRTGGGAPAGTDRGVEGGGGLRDLLPPHEDGPRALRIALSPARRNGATRSGGLAELCVDRIDA
ncbi:hypothetical protein [Streptomyces roseolus]|uniref:hypothetical protein n=1 Tax=Streptomyces roseolus TaxID=67358 RepID=UPI003F4D03CC